MKPVLLAAAAALFLQSSVHAAIPTGVPLLDRIVTHPGSYSQVCDVMTAPEDIPYRAYQVSSFAGAAFSKANLAAMKENRGALVRDLRARLLQIDFLRIPVEVKKDPAPEESFDGEDIGCDPRVFNPLLLQMVLELDATEALPELLAVESKLVKGIAAAKNKASAPVPVVTGWFVAQEHAPREDDEAERERRIALFQSRVAQRDLVLTIARLLRGAGYEPYRKSAIEKAFVKGLREDLKASGLGGFKPGDPLPASPDYSGLAIDPFTKLPHDPYFHVSIPYTRESRDEVRALAAKWISEH